MHSQAAVVTPLLSTDFIRDEAQLQLLSMREQNHLKLPPLNTHFFPKLTNCPSVAGLEEAAPTLSQSQHPL